MGVQGDWGVDGIGAPIPCRADFAGRTWSLRGEITWAERGPVGTPAVREAKPVLGEAPFGYGNAVTKRQPGQLQTEGGERRDVSKDGDDPRG
jgi:hypothetical protein